MLFILGQAIPSCGRRAFLVARDRGEVRGVGGHDATRAGVDLEPPSRNLEGTIHLDDAAAGRDLVVVDDEDLNLGAGQLSPADRVAVGQGDLTEILTTGPAELIDGRDAQDHSLEGVGLRAGDEAREQQGDESDLRDHAGGEGGTHFWTPFGGQVSYLPQLWGVLALSRKNMRRSYHSAKRLSDSNELV